MAVANSQAGRGGVPRRTIGQRDDAHAPGGADVRGGRATLRRAAFAAADWMARRSRRHSGGSRHLEDARTTRASVDARGAIDRGRVLPHGACRSFFATLWRAAAAL